MKLEAVIRFLKEYRGPKVTLMEVCGSHTAAIAASGIKDMLSERIRLVSGPGCPVCVTPTAYIDRLIALALEPSTCVVTFGDLLRVPGSRQSLSQAKGDGAAVNMVYSPMDTVKLAKDNPGITYVFAAVGFETTTPVYALLLQKLQEEGIKNVKLLTALKTMPQVIAWLCDNKAEINGFLAPGHVCAVTGYGIFTPLAEKYGIPFGVAGFSPEEILVAIYGILQMTQKKAAAANFYPSAVTREGNLRAQNKIAEYFETSDAVWRGIGLIKGSGRMLKQEFSSFDAGSGVLTADIKINAACCCDQILTGQMEPVQCPLFQKTCRPETPQGACMVSAEGSCYQSCRN